MSSFNSAYGAGLSPRPHLVRMVREGKKDHASFHRASMQTGSNTSPGLLASVVAGSHGGETTPFSFHASGASFKRGNVIQSLIDVAAMIFIPLYMLLLISVIVGLLPFAFFCLLFVSFH